MRGPTHRAMTTVQGMIHPTTMITTMTEESTAPAMIEMLMVEPPMMTMRRGTDGLRTMRATGNTARSSGVSSKYSITKKFT